VGVQSPIELIIDCSKDMSWAVNNELLHDVIIVVSDGEDTKKFVAHKVVLCARSPYFNALLTGGLKVCFAPFLLTACIN